MNDFPNALNSEQTDPLISDLLKLFPRAFQSHNIEGKQVYATMAHLPLPESKGLVFDLILHGNQPILVLRDQSHASAQLDAANIQSLIEQTKKFATSQNLLKDKLFDQDIPDQLKGVYVVPCRLRSTGQEEAVWTQVLDLKNSEQFEFVKSLLTQSQKASSQSPS